MLDQGVQQVLVKMGKNGSVLVRAKDPAIHQPAILAPLVVDTAGASDTFTAAYTVALIEHQTPIEALGFAGKLFGFILQYFERYSLLYNSYLFFQCGVLSRYSNNF